LRGPIDGGAQLLPVLQDVLQALPAQAVGRLLLAERRLSEAVASLRPRVLARRGVHPTWSWRKAHLVETALFCDPLCDPGIWTKGPNGRSACNVLEREGDVAPWLWLSGGTDWQGFQGGFRCVSERGLMPSWVTFRVRVSTPELSGAFLALSGGQHLWGLADPVFVFNYRGDDCSSNCRCFTVQPYSGYSTVSHFVRPQPEVEDRPYSVALHLDWDAGALSVFVDGQQHLCNVPFKASTAIRFAAIYNWRSGARTAFSELMLGNERPCELPASVEFQGRQSRCRLCCRRSRSHGALPGRRAAPLAAGGLCTWPWAARGAFLVGAVAVALHWASLT